MLSERIQNSGGSAAMPPQHAHLVPNSGGAGFCHRPCFWVFHLHPVGTMLPPSHDKQTVSRVSTNRKHPPRWWEAGGKHATPPGCHTPTSHAHHTTPLGATPHHATPTPRPVQATPLMPRPWVPRPCTPASSTRIAPARHAPLHATPPCTPRPLQATPFCREAGQARSALTQGHEGFVVFLHEVVVQLLLPLVQVLPLVLGEVNGNVHKSHRNLGQQEFYFYFLNFFFF